MSRLVLELRAGEMLLLNGAVVQFETKTRLLLCTHARFVFGKQVMRPEGATTSARRMYLAVQDAYVGDAAGRRDALDRAEVALNDYLRSEIVVDEWRAAEISLERALVLARADSCHEALRLIVEVMRQEDHASAPVLEPAQ